MYRVEINDYAVRRVGVGVCYDFFLNRISRMKGNRLAFLRFSVAPGEINIR